MSGSANTVNDWIDTYLTREEPRSKSLIVSVFGDAIAPYARGVWLGELIQLMQAFRLSERLVRTSAFRLIDEGWLSAERQGRRSFYALTRSGAERFEAAYEHIYQPPEEHWDGKWTLVVLQRAADPTPERNELRRDLEWSGFALLANGVFIHPSAPVAATREAVERSGLSDRAIVFRAATNGVDERETDDARVLSSWDMEEVRSRYVRFLKIFAPLEELTTSHPLTPANAFQVQTLLIHSFRRANLHDPCLPTPLLPSQWPGRQAFDLCRNIYTRTCPLAHQHVGQVAGIDTSIAAGTRLNMHVEARFGGWAKTGRDTVLQSPRTLPSR